MSLVFNRTRGESEKAAQPADYWPAGLVTEADRRASNPPLVRITGKDLQRMMGVQ